MSKLAATQKPLSRVVRDGLTVSLLAIAMATGAVVLAPSPALAQVGPIQYVNEDGRQKLDSFSVRLAAVQYGDVTTSKPYVRVYAEITNTSGKPALLTSRSFEGSVMQAGKRFAKRPDTATYSFSIPSSIGGNAGASSLAPRTLQPGGKVLILCIYQLDPAAIRTPMTWTVREVPLIALPNKKGASVTLLGAGYVPQTKSVPDPGPKAPPPPPARPLPNVGLQTLPALSSVPLRLGPWAVRVESVSYDLKQQTNPGVAIVRLTFQNTQAAPAKLSTDWLKPTIALSTDTWNRPSRTELKFGGLNYAGATEVSVPYGDVADVTFVFETTSEALLRTVRHLKIDMLQPDRPFATASTDLPKFTASAASQSPPAPTPRETTKTGISITQPTPEFVQGQVTDESGKPLAGVEVTARYQSNPGGSSIQRGPSYSGADGRYSLGIKDPAGTWSIHGYTTVGGLRIELTPNDPALFAGSAGAIRDLRVQYRELKGDKDPESDSGIGGFVVVTQPVGQSISMDQVELTVSPASGGAATTRRLRRTGDGYVLTGLRPDTYQVTARYKDVPMLISLDGASNWAASQSGTFATSGINERQLRVMVKPGSGETGTPPPDTTPPPGDTPPPGNTPPPGGDQGGGDTTPIDQRRYLITDPAQTVGRWTVKADRQYFRGATYRITPNQVEVWLKVTNTSPLPQAPSQSFQFYLNGRHGRFASGKITYDIDGKVPQGKESTIYIAFPMLEADQAWIKSMTVTAIEQPLSPLLGSPKEVGKVDVKLLPRPSEAASQTAPKPQPAPAPTPAPTPTPQPAPQPAPPPPPPSPPVNTPPADPAPTPGSEAAMRALEGAYTLAEGDSLTLRYSGGLLLGDLRLGPNSPVFGTLKLAMTAPGRLTGVMHRPEDPPQRMWLAMDVLVSSDGSLMQGSGAYVHFPSNSPRPFKAQRPIPAPTPAPQPADQGGNSGGGFKATDYFEVQVERVGRSSLGGVEVVLTVRNTEEVRKGVQYDTQKYFLLGSDGMEYGTDGNYYGRSSAEKLRDTTWVFKDGQAPATYLFPRVPNGVKAIRLILRHNGQQTASFDLNDQSQGGSAASQTGRPASQTPARPAAPSRIGAYDIAFVSLQKGDDGDWESTWSLTNRTQEPTAVQLNDLSVTLSDGAGRSATGGGPYHYAGETGRRVRRSGFEIAPGEETKVRIWHSGSKGMAPSAWTFSVRGQMGRGTLAGAGVP